MNENQFTRTIGLLGEEGFNKLSSSHILVCGLGGVGGTALEALARSGVSNFTLIDFDKVAPSNLNRQILYVNDDIGQNKVDIAKKRILDINKSIKVVIIDNKVDENLLNTLEDKYSFILDAIDDIPAKIALGKYALKNDIPIISSLGMANRLDPTKVIITRLDKTTDDPLAKKLRYEYKKAGVDTKLINVAFSKETPIKDGNKLHSMMMVPSSSGLAIASYIIQELIK